MEADGRNLCSHGSHQLGVDAWGRPTVRRQIVVYAMSELAMVLIISKSTAERHSRTMSGPKCVRLR